MKSNAASNESILTISSGVFALLDPYHRALAEVLSERGEVRILDAPEAGR